MTQLTPLQRIGHATIGVGICAYLAAMFIFPHTRYAEILNTAVLYALGGAFLVAAVWLVYHSARAAITGKFF